MVNELDKKSNPAVWGGIALLVAIALVGSSVFAEKFPGTGETAKTVAVIVAVILGTLGAVIGDAMRRFALPKRIYSTNGMTGLMKAKLFWMIGPQVIGVLLGVWFGEIIALMMFAPTH